MVVMTQKKIQNSSYLRLVHFFSVFSSIFLNLK